MIAAADESYLMDESIRSCSASLMPSRPSALTSRTSAGGPTCAGLQLDIAGVTHLARVLSVALSSEEIEIVVEKLDKERRGEVSIQDLWSALVRAKRFLAQTTPEKRQWSKRFFERFGESLSQSGQSVQAVFLARSAS